MTLTHEPIEGEHFIVVSETRWVTRSQRSQTIDDVDEDDDDRVQMTHTQTRGAEQTQ